MDVARNICAFSIHQPSPVVAVHVPTLFSIIASREIALQVPLVVDQILVVAHKQDSVSTTVINALTPATEIARKAEADLKVEDDLITEVDPTAEILTTEISIATDAPPAEIARKVALLPLGPLGQTEEEVPHNLLLQLTFHVAAVETAAEIGSNSLIKFRSQQLRILLIMPEQTKLCSLGLCWPILLLQ